MRVIAAVCVVALLVIFAFVMGRIAHQQAEQERCDAARGVYVSGHCLLAIEIPL